MKRHIDNPYKVNWKMYGLIGGLATLIMIIAAICSDMTNNLFSDMVKNLAYGCVASTIVALLIEVGNIKEKNENANRIYDAVYIELKCQIILFVASWSHLCRTAFKDEDYQQEKHTWIEWYEITKRKFEECNDKRKAELSSYFKDQLLLGVDGIERALKQIDNQQYLLTIYGLCDQKLRSIIENYRFEFEAVKYALKRNFDNNHFWSEFDAIKNDLINYIQDWVDIRYYNYYKSNPYLFFDDITETERAILESERSNK